MILKFKEQKSTEKPNKKQNKVEFVLVDDDPEIDVKVTLKLESDNLESLEDIIEKTMDKPVEMTLKNL